jgi:protein translocase SecG subunit
MLRTIWTFSSFFLIIIIILQNPKAQSTSNQGQIFGGTRATEVGVYRVTWVLALIFLFLTVSLSVFDS